MTRKKPYSPVTTGVSFHPSVIEYLDRACDDQGCDRSALIDRIIREYALWTGSPVEDGRLQHIVRIRTVGRAI